MPTITEIKTATRRVPVHLDPVTIHVDVYPSRYNPEWRRRFIEFQRRQEEAGAEESVEDVREASEIFLSVAAGWDVTDDAGNPLPLTAQFVMDELGFTHLTTINQTIMESLRPNA